MARVKERLQSQPDLLSMPNEKCPYVSNDHPPICQQEYNFPCTKCPNYLDGLCDLIPWDKETMTENQGILKLLYKKRDEMEHEIGTLYKVRYVYDDAIYQQLIIVRKEQGR